MASMTPSADVLALANAEVDISAVEPGQGITVKWRGKPIFIRRRLEHEIEEMAVSACTSILLSEWSLSLWRH